MADHPVEVELKFPVDSIAELRPKLLELGANPTRQSQQTDEYINDPLRDFAKLDLALRIRQSDNRFFVTFKGPNLDPLAKSRVEIETALVDEKAAQDLKATFLGIGFFSVANVAKRRETLELTWENRSIEVCLDEVAEVGDFVELELVIESRDQMEQARVVLEGLAQALGLEGAIRTSYLELLLKERGEL